MIANEAKLGKWSLLVAWLTAVIEKILNVIEWNGRIKLNTTSAAVFVSVSEQLGLCSYSCILSYVVLAKEAILFGLQIDLTDFGVFVDAW